MIEHSTHIQHTIFFCLMVGNLYTHFIFFVKAQFLYTLTNITAFSLKYKYTEMFS